MREYLHALMQRYIILEGYALELEMNGKFSAEDERTAPIQSF